MFQARSQKNVNGGLTQGAPISMQSRARRGDAKRRSATGSGAWEGCCSPSMEVWGLCYENVGYTASNI